jgi:hypothetical protein
MDSNGKEKEAIELSTLDSITLDSILATEDDIAPSSGFLAAVMERVEDQARMPAPIPFPWKRALPGFVLACVVFGWVGMKVVQWAVSAMRSASFAAPHVPIAMALPLQQARWVALALLVSLASWLLARRLAGRPDVL